MADSDDSKGPEPPNADDPNAADDAVSAPEEEESVPPVDEYVALYERHIERLIATARDDFGGDLVTAVEPRRLKLLGMEDAATACRA